MSFSFIGILVLAGILNFLYFFPNFRLRKKPALTDVIALVVTAMGMVGAIKLMVALPQITGSDDDRLCVLVGSISLLWVSIQSALAIYKK